MLAPHIGGHSALRVPLRRRTPAAVALVAGLVLPILVGLAAHGRRRRRPTTVQPLPANLEAIRAAEATALYGSPDDPPARPAQDRAGHHGRQRDLRRGRRQLRPRHPPGRQLVRPLVRPGGVPHRHRLRRPVQHRLLRRHPVEPDPRRAAPSTTSSTRATTSRSRPATRKIKLLWVVVGANGDGTIQFGPVATECALDRVLFRGACYPHVHRRVDRAGRGQPGGRRAGADRHQADDDRRRLPAPATTSWCFQSYPSPASPDVEDNPNFPGWYSGGCLLYLADTAFARNKAVPLFEGGLRRAAAQHRTCATSTPAGSSTATRCAPTTPSVRGLYIEVGRLERERRPAVVPPQRPRPRRVRRVHDAVLQLGLPAGDLRRPGQHRARHALQWTVRVQAAAQRRHRQVRRRQGLRLAQQHSAAVVHLPRRAQPGLLVRPDAAVAARRAVPRPVPRRRRRVDHAPAPRSTSTTATAAPTSSWSSPATRSSRPANTALCLAFDSPLFGGRRGCGWRTAGRAPGSSGRSSRATSRTRSGYGHDDFIGDRVY